MCRSIKVLRRPGQAATREELNSAALQFVRKISGFHRPSKANEAAFERAVAEISGSGERLLDALGVAPAPRGKRRRAVLDTVDGLDGGCFSGGFVCRENNTVQFDAALCSLHASGQSGEKPADDDVLINADH